MQTPIIRDKIYDIRGQKVMLDFDLAALYGVETKVFNQAVKRNINRFPEDFMFQLTLEEWNSSQIVMSLDVEAEVVDNQKDGRWSQIVTTSEGEKAATEDVDNQSSGRRSQIVTTSVKFRGKGVLPYAFTEHGVSMLASVLRSEKAVQMSIAVVRAFIALKQYAIRQDGMSQQLQEIRDRLGEHDVQLNSIYEAIENLLDEKVGQRNWEDRERIGFKAK
jgi:phage regulator Rha-like protein